MAENKQGFADFMFFYSIEKSFWIKIYMEKSYKTKKSKYLIDLFIDRSIEQKARHFVTALELTATDLSCVYWSRILIIFGILLNENKVVCRCLEFTRFFGALLMYFFVKTMVKVSSRILFFWSTASKKDKRKTNRSRKHCSFDNQISGLRFRAEKNSGLQERGFTDFMFFYSIEKSF